MLPYYILYSVEGEVGISIQGQGGGTETRDHKNRHPAVAAFPRSATVCRSTVIKRWTCCFRLPQSYAPLATPTPSPTLTSTTSLCQ